MSLFKGLIFRIKLIFIGTTFFYMNLKRRAFIQASALSLGGIGISKLDFLNGNTPMEKVLSNLEPMTEGIKPIGKEERLKRVEKAQRLMKENNLKGIILDCGTSLEYFLGVIWWPSERTMVAIIPAEGEVRYICPRFEVARLQELVQIGKIIYPWDEDESPYLEIAKALGDAGIQNGQMGIEERLRYFILNGIQKAAPALNFISADPVTIPCRLIKSQAEIDIMQRATEMTTSAMKLGIKALRLGMAPSEFSDMVNEAHIKFGAEPDFALCNFAEASAYPHGSVKPQKLNKGDIVLIDCGCRFLGYSSDMSRTLVFGSSPSPRQLEVWNLEKKAQAAGFMAAKLGDPCMNVDAAARKVIVDAGFGPGYQLPGLPHRTGHGIGMDGHEWGNMVKGNTLPLQVGMCFSIEPNISIPGEFGVRLEDCVQMTESGPKWFSNPSPSIDQPFV